MKKTVWTLFDKCHIEFEKLSDHNIELTISFSISILRRINLVKWHIFHLNCCPKNQFLLEQYKPQICVSLSQFWKLASQLFSKCGNLLFLILKVTRMRNILLFSSRMHNILQYPKLDYERTQAKSHTHPFLNGFTSKGIPMLPIKQKCTGTAITKWSTVDLKIYVSNVPVGCAKELATWSVCPVAHLPSLPSF